jgi:hypothetical protein
MLPTDARESLPFIVRTARTTRDHAALSVLRAEAYARHDYLPGVSERLRSIDEADLRSTLLVAEDKDDGSIIGTIRVSSSLRGTTPVPPELPSIEFAGEPFTYVDRFAARQGPLADVVALALIKAQWFCAYQEGVEWIIAAALPALARRYRMVGLRTLEGADRGRFRIPHLHEKSYEAVGERLSGMPANLRRAAPFLAPFFLEKDHPDILIAKPAALTQHIAAARQACAEPKDSDAARRGTQPGASVASASTRDAQNPLGEAIIARASRMRPAPNDNTSLS